MKFKLSKDSLLCELPSHCPNLITCPFSSDVSEHLGGYLNGLIFICKKQKAESGGIAAIHPRPSHPALLP